MNEQNKPLMYRFIRGMIRVCYPKLEVVGAENIPEEPAIIVGNHCQTNGPIASLLYIPKDHYTWCAGQMMELKEVPGYAFQDFWSQKPRWTHPFYKLASYLIAPVSVFFFNNADTIAVHRDIRIFQTFKETAKRLEEGVNVVIFPEYDAKYNHILYDFRTGFIDSARMYYRRTGKEVAFVPMYVAPRLRKIVFGQPIRFRAEEKVDLERERIRGYLMQTITDMARALPEHTVVPYRNIPRKLYPSNKEAAHENPNG